MSVSFSTVFGIIFTVAWAVIMICGVTAAVMRLTMKRPGQAAGQSAQRPPERGRPAQRGAPAQPYRAPKTLPNANAAQRAATAQEFSAGRYREEDYYQESLKVKDRDWDK